MGIICLVQWQNLMTIIELLEHVGQENIMLQWLPECQIRAQSTKQGAQITFGTTGVSTNELAAEALTGQPPKNLGMILWLPVERLPEAIKAKLSSPGAKTS